MYLCVSDSPFSSREARACIVRDRLRSMVGSLFSQGDPQILGNGKMGVPRVPILRRKHSIHDIIDVIFWGLAGCLGFSALPRGLVAVDLPCRYSLHSRQFGGALGLCYH